MTDAIHTRVAEECRSYTVVQTERIHDQCFKVTAERDGYPAHLPLVPPRRVEFECRNREDVPRCGSVLVLEWRRNDGRD